MKMLPPTRELHVFQLVEVAQQVANHESARTAGLYGRRNDQISLDEVKRILI